MNDSDQDKLSQSDVAAIREDEHFLLEQITQKLADAWDAEKAALQKKAEAISLTRLVWSHFCDSLVLPDNRMPDEVRKLLLGLGLWVERETASINEGKSDMEALINVNRQIADGLKPLA
ncbi:MAG: flagellar biosynthesis regulator FlaF [Azospirillaceae bacterium]|nr:flagellar biosynthesis regulator FlaF [Azospirillaceae bacterium]